MRIDTSTIRVKPTKVYYLKMINRPKENLVLTHSPAVTQLEKPIDPTEYMKYYTGVGSKFSWVDRLIMPVEDLKQKINAENVYIFAMTMQEEPMGFIELVREGEYVELLYFGLFPKFIGKGLGKYLLDWSIHQAWSYNPKWIQLNTCELDHPNALPTYRKLGFQDYKMAIEERRILAG